MNKKEIVLYFANWNLNRKPANHGGEVASLPWENVTFVNHAFWGVTPVTDKGMTSFERRDKKLPPRKDFSICSMYPEYDLEDKGESAIISGLARNHFAQYEYFSKKYPNVKIMLSIGGWSRCGYFSEMAYTAEGRSSFVDACIEFLKKYPFMGGIDIDWEYPGCSLSGERAADTSADDGDEGCPIWGTAKEDSVNLSLLLKELREKLDENFGKGSKALTACAGASVANTLPCQDWALISENLDIINMMTYDLAGVWDGITGHASSLKGTKAAIDYMKAQGIPENKLCIGSPLYAIAFMLEDGNVSEKVGAKCTGSAAAPASICEDECAEFTKNLAKDGEPGWKKVFDEEEGGVYLYNNDPDSEHYGWFLSYEDEITLQNKLDYINNTDLAGIIVWESSQDTNSHSFLKQMSEALL